MFPIPCDPYSHSVYPGYSSDVEPSIAKNVNKNNIATLSLYGIPMKTINIQVSQCMVNYTNTQFQYISKYQTADMAVDRHFGILKHK